MNGEETCFNNINRCNSFAQCDPAEGSDIGEDEVDCNEEYKKKGLVPRKATFCCQSRHHNADSVNANISRGVVYIHAVFQDGNPECWNGEDEEPSTIPKEWVSFYLPGIDWTIVIMFSNAM